MEKPHSQFIKKICRHLNPYDIQCKGNRSGKANITTGREKLSVNERPRSRDMMREVPSNIDILTQVNGHAHRLTFPPRY